MADFTIGIDLGGTKILGVLFGKDAKPVTEIKLRTPGTTNGNDIKDLIVQMVKDLLAHEGLGPKDLAALGVAVPGAVDFHRGVVLDTPNIGFKDYPLAALLKKAFDCPILVENDVNAGVYGEFTFGAAKGYQNIIGIFPGTGIGGGMVLNGMLYRGSRGSAGEVGHTRVQDGGRLCGCGRYGCLETVASKTALAKDLVALAATGAAPTIAAEAGTDFALMKSGLIKKSIKAGEKAVIELVQRMAFYLGIGMANCVNLFDPDVIILGGGLVEKLEDEIVPAAERSMRDHAQSHMVKGVKVLVSSLGDHAVATGVAVLARQVG